ncbi:19569_t:CDS:2, partial [Racocetra persica]
AELAYSLLFNKVYLNKKEKDLGWLDVFPYHLELFSTSRTILSEIKELISQEPIPSEKLGFFSTVTSKTLSKYNFSSLNIDIVPIFDNPTELLSELEILLCFLKRTSGDREMEITNYLNKWMRLSTLTENQQFQKMVNGLRLKHVVALYELVEEKIADVEIEYLSDQYKVQLSEHLKNEINSGINFEQSHSTGGSEISEHKIPHGAFALVLKRFMFRYLTSEMYNPNEMLANYLARDTFIDCWPVWVTDDVIRDKFPKSLLAAHIYHAYQYTIQNIKKTTSYNINNNRQKDIPAKPSSNSNIRGESRESRGNRGIRGGRGGRGR